MTEPMKTENERFNLYLHEQDDGIKKWLKDVSESDYDLVSKFEREIRYNPGTKAKVILHKAMQEYAAMQVAAERERIKKEIYKVFGDSVVEEWSSSRIRKEILEKLIDSL